MRFRLFLSIAALTLMMAVAASADVIVQRQTTIDNLFGLGGSTTTQTEYVKSDRSYSESETKFDSKLMKFATHGKAAKEATIIRLDQGVMQNLDLDKKTYTEMDLNTFKGLADSASALMSQEPKAPSGEMNSGEQMPDQEEYDWTFKVTKDDKDTKINGFNCNHVTATATGVNKTDSTKKILITNEQWLTEDDPSIGEMKEYEQNYAKQLGIDPEAMKAAWGRVLSGFTSQMSDLGEQMKDVKGFPIKTIISMEAAVPENEGNSDENTSVDQQTDQNAAAQEAMKKLGGLFGKKKDKDKEKKAAAPETPGFKRMFSATTEVLSVKQTSVPDSQYDVPAGFTKSTE